MIYFWGLVGFDIFFYGIWIIVVKYLMLYSFMKNTKRLQDLPLEIAKMKIFFLNGSNLLKDTNKKSCCPFGRIEST